MYEVRVVANVLDAKGNQKEVKEMYIVQNAMTCAECEMKVMELYNGGCDVISIVRSKIREIVTEKEYDDEHYYKATITEISVDENGKEKENKYYVLVPAKDLTGANKLMLEYLKQGMQDFRLDAIVKTKIISVINIGD